MIFPVAHLLLERSVPFRFMTGYDQSVIPERFKATVRCEKALQLEVLCRTMREFWRATHDGVCHDVQASTGTAPRFLPHRANLL